MEMVYDWGRRQWNVQPSTAALTATKVATAVHAAMLPARVMATTVAVDPSGFGGVVKAALDIADWLCVGVIMFAGGSWMFGDRTRAMQHLIGGGVGYIIIRKAYIIQQFLKSL